MEKISNSDIEKLKIKMICWDLDGALFDTEIVWYKMQDLVIEKFGLNLSKEEINVAQEKIAAEMYRTIGYRGNAEKALSYFKTRGIYQSLINQCALTNKAMMMNPSVIAQFKFENFDSIISENDFSEKCSKKDMYLKALDVAKISEPSQVIAIDDLPEGLEGAKAVGMTTVWARNQDYPFNEQELSEIEKFADYYIDDFSELIG